MATDQQFADYAMEQLRGVDRVSHKKMFGEYGVYVGEKMVALMCDNQFFVKPTVAGRALFTRAGTPVEAPPYPRARPHYLIEGDLEDAAFMARLIAATERELPAPKAKKAKKVAGKQAVARKPATQKPAARKPAAKKPAARKAAPRK